MKLTFLSGVLLFNLNFCFSQIKYDKIEFEHSNPIIMSSYTKIKFLPIKNNKKGKVKIIFEDKTNNEVIMNLINILRTKQTRKMTEDEIKDLRRKKINMRRRERAVFEP